MEDSSTKGDFSETGQWLTEPAVERTLHRSPPLLEDLLRENAELRNENAELQKRLVLVDKKLRETDAKLMAVEKKLVHVVEKKRDTDDAARRIIGIQKHLNETDQLTQAYNKRGFMSYGLQTHSRALQSQEPYAVLFVDADHFKQINDTYGHDVGDEVLKILARRMKNVDRNNEGRESDKVCRYGGEEFAILLPNCETIKDAQNVAERIRQKIANSKFHLEDGRQIPMTVSIGVAHWAPGDESKFTDVVKRADQAVYQVKHKGRNRVGYVDEDFTRSLIQEKEKAKRPAADEDTAKLPVLPHVPSTPA